MDPSAVASSSAEAGPSSLPKSKSQRKSLGLFIQPACLQHRYIRHPNASHIFERPERLRAVLLGVAAGVARLEAASESSTTKSRSESRDPSIRAADGGTDDLSGLLSSLNLGSGTSTAFTPPTYLSVVPPPLPASVPGTILLHHPAVQLVHSTPPEAPFPYVGPGAASRANTASFPQSSYLRDLFKWASEAVEKIKETGSEIPQGLGLNQGDLYLGPGSVLAIEGAIQTACQAIDKVCARPVLDDDAPKQPVKVEPSTPPGQRSQAYTTNGNDANGGSPPNSRFSPSDASIKKAFCVIRPPGHHCGEDAPSGFCYINNVVVAAMHAYLQHDIDRAIIIDFDLHHGNGTQALVMPLNAASHAEDMMVKAGKPVTMFGKEGRARRGWKGFYGSVHDIYSYPCEDGDIDLVKDASISLAAHGQYIENIHLQPYESEADFYARIYPLYLALLDKAKVYMRETNAEAGRTIVLISAGFDACEHEHQGMQRHDRRVPTSFFSRYTKDIVAFADQYTEGKVVSVLEGGYSDRALTSAAMGHIVGMGGHLPEGCEGWWTEAELVSLEKATKKRRNGKLAPFPSELSSQPHLLRTHALLNHFEGHPSSDGGGGSAAPSVASTPQHAASRMTLRDRSKKPDHLGDAEVTPPARRAVRGRAQVTSQQQQAGGNGSASCTPRQKSAIGGPATATTTTPIALKSSAAGTGTGAGAGTPNARATRIKSEDNVASSSSTMPQPKSDGAPAPAPLFQSAIDGNENDLERRIQQSNSSGGDIILDRVVVDMAGVSLVPTGNSAPPSPAPSAPADTDKEASDSHTPSHNLGVAPLPPAPNPLIPPPPPPPTATSNITPSYNQAKPDPSGTIPKIILRIPRPPSSHPLPDPVSSDASTTNPTLYPSLPATNQLPEMDGRMAYREASTTSEDTGTSGTDGTDGEYASALSALSEEEQARASRETTSTSTSTGTSNGPDMPGGYGR